MGKLNNTELIKFITSISKISDLYEKTDSDLKIEYIKRNIEAFRKIVSRVPGNGGFFCTGYPFYALDSDLNGKLPLIKEQLDYNNRLIEEAKKSKRTIWRCRGCLKKNYKNMPDLKEKCKPCLKMDSKLKPRKVINRLPDMDLWLVCSDGHVEDAEQVLSKLFSKYGLSSSDIDPLKTIADLGQIVEELKKGNIPKKLLPIDVHIIEFSKLKGLIRKVPEEIDLSIKTSSAPCLEISPKSLRKQWQYDDEPYNFVHDFLLSFTEYDFNKSLEKELISARKKIAEKYTSEELYSVLWNVLKAPGKRRFTSAPELKSIFQKKIESWKELVIEPQKIPKTMEEL